MATFAESFLWIEFGNNIFFVYYSAVYQPTLSHYWRDSLTQQVLITRFISFWPEGQKECCEPKPNS